MRLRWRKILAILALTPVAAIAAGPFTSIHPEEAIPDPSGRPSQSPYTAFITQVQQKLQELGFHAGPPNGDFGEKTQAALAQFQLSRTLPVSGQLDDPTLAALGITREVATAAAGASSPPPAE